MKQVKTILALLASISLLVACDEDTTSGEESDSNDNVSSTSEIEGEYTITKNFEACGNNNLTSTTTFSLLADGGSAPIVTASYVENGVYYNYSNWENDYVSKGYIDLLGEQGDAPLAFEKSSYSVNINSSTALNLTVYGDDGSSIVWSSSSEEVVISSDEPASTDNVVAWLHDGVLTAYSTETSFTITVTLGNHSKSTSITIEQKDAEDDDGDNDEEEITASITQKEAGSYLFTVDNYSNLVIGDMISDTSFYDKYCTPIDLAGSEGTAIRNAFVHSGIGSSAYGDFYLNSPDYPSGEDQSDYLELLEKMLGIYEVVSNLDEFVNGFQIDYCKLTVGSRSTTLTFVFYGTYNNGYDGFQITSTILSQGSTSYANIDNFLGLD